MKTDGFTDPATDTPACFDMVVVGSGFSGSLAALMLYQSGFRTCLIEKGHHPRFSIGESSTPAADMILRSISESYNLPWLSDLSRYGSWQNSYPNITCGIKRGFSYYRHEQGNPFMGNPEHSCDLLVAASENEQNSDTHWLREEVDHFLVKKIREMGIPYYDNTTVNEVNRQSIPSQSRTGDSTRPGIDVNTGDKTDSGANGFGPSVDSASDQQWTIEIVSDNTRRRISTSFIIDATGGPAFSTRFLGTELIRNGFKTQSMAIYSHFKNVQTWSGELQKNSCPTGDYPFNPDQSALHHLIDEGWFWMLRFNNNLLSAGAVLDLNGLSGEKIQDSDYLWNRILNRYPSIQHCFSDAQLAETPGRLLQTGMLQRRLSSLSGDGWVALNNSAGFIDPLHSTGIAHTLVGLEKVIGILTQSHKDPDKRREELQQHEKDFFNELNLIDHLVANCYLTRHHFPLFTASTMLYFVCVIDFEGRRLRGESQALFLSADNKELTSIVTRCYEELRRMASKELSSSVHSSHSRSSAQARFVEKIREQIAPFNSVGLLDERKKNMYCHTAVSL